MAVCNENVKAKDVKKEIDLIIKNIKAVKVSKKDN